MSNKKKIAIILEDVPMNAEVLKDTLISTNLFDEIIIFSKIESAADYLNNGNQLPDVLFLDLYFKNDSNDFEHAFTDFMDEFEDQLGSTKICVVTASEHLRDFEKVSVYQNIIGIIEKPITVIKVAEILKKI